MTDIPPRTRNAIAVVRILALATMAACTDPTQDVQEPTVTQQAAQRDQLSQRCTNSQDGFSVSYPAGWHTNSGEVIAECSAFDRQPIDVPRGSEMPFDIAVVIDAGEVPFETTAGPSRWERILSTERMTVAGRQAVRAEVEATGEGLADRGMRSLRYVVDLGGGRSIIATTHDTDPSYERDKEILARMMQTLSVP